MMASESLPAAANASPLFVNSSMAACGSLEHAAPDTTTRTTRPQSERAITGMAAREIICRAQEQDIVLLGPCRDGCLSAALKAVTGVVRSGLRSGGSLVPRIDDFSRRAAAGCLPCRQVPPHS